MSPSICMDVQLCVVCVCVSMAKMECCNLLCWYFREWFNKSQVLSPVSDISSCDKTIKIQMTFAFILIYRPEKKSFVRL